MPVISYINSIVILIDPRIDPEISDLPGPNLDYPDPRFIFPEKCRWSSWISFYLILIDPRIDPEILLFNRHIDRFQNSHDEFTAYNPLEAECYADFIIETLGALSVMVYINDKPYYHRNKTSKKFYN